MATKILYKFPKVIWLTQVNQGVQNDNMNPNETDFRVYKGAYADLEFICRNEDRKPIALQDKTLTFTLINPVNNELILQRDMQILDPYAGRIKMTLTPGDLQDLRLGFYHYSVLMVGPPGIQKLLFTDRNQNAAGYIELLSGVLPDLGRTIKIPGETFYQVQVQDINPNTVVSYTGAYPAPAEHDLSNGLATTAAYMTDWTGIYAIQGTIENTPSQTQATVNPSDWVTIQKFTFTSSFTGIQPYVIQGNWLWFRFYYIPDPNNVGTFDQILLKS